MPNIKIAIINESTVVSDSDAKAAVDALQRQVSNDFAPAWGIDASLTFLPSGSNPSPDAWWLVILDTSDQAGALGYHDITSAGLPLGKVFAKSDVDFGSSWTITASHELLEMLGDPDINLSALVQTSETDGTLYAYEVCDADFVFPAWFEGFREQGTQFDFQQKITAPFQLLPGGYIGAFDIYSGSGWYQLYPAKTAVRYSMRPRLGSRRDRRRTPRHQWMKSDLTISRQKGRTTASRK
ncbi:MAG: hypothetical protein HYR85_08365 [Planctomycetes bacterium]|nr:hypothetical protein [Planctomycetota bacterium]